MVARKVVSRESATAVEDQEPSLGGIKESVPLRGWGTSGRQLRPDVAGQVVGPGVSRAEEWRRPFARVCLCVRGARQLGGTTCPTLLV